MRKNKILIGILASSISLGFVVKDSFAASDEPFSMSQTNSEFVNKKSSLNYKLKKGRLRYKNRLEIIEEFQARVDKASTLEELIKIEEEYTPLEEIYERQYQAVQSFDKLEYLSDQEKEEFSERIYKATLRSEINEITREARLKNQAYQLEDYKKIAINSIKKLTHRTDEEKEEYIKRIEACDTGGSVRSIESEAYKDKVVIETKSQEIDFKIEKLEDENLDFGKEETIKEGEKGELRLTIKTTYRNKAEPIVEESEERIKEPINKVVKIGTKKSPVESEKIETEEEAIPFETKTTYDESLEEGKQIIDQEGIDGIKTYTHKIKLIDGEEISRETSFEITKEPIDKIVRIGRKKSPVESEKIETEEEVIPFETKTTYDESLEEGKEVVDQEGVNGIKTYTHKIKLVDDKEISRETSFEITKEPIDKIVRIGRKKSPVESEKIETEEEVIPFETKTIYDESLEEGKEIIDQEGIDGIKTYTHKIKLVDGEEISRETSFEISKEPTHKIVRVGTKKAALETEKLEKEEEKIPFETRFIKDSSLEKGKEVVVVEGSEGIKTFIHTIKLVNEKEVSRTTSSKITKKPVDKVIRVGTKIVDKNSDTNKPLANPKLDIILKENQDSKLEQKDTNPVLNAYPKTFTLPKLGTNPRPKVQTTKSDLSYTFVPKGYKYIKTGYYKKDDLRLKEFKLKEAIRRNQITVEAVRLLFKHTPKTVKSVRGDLEDLLLKSDKLIIEAQLALDELEKVLN